jgi:hypothetical protein
MFFLSSSLKQKTYSTMACSFGVTQPTLRTAHMVCTSQTSRGDLRLISRLALSVYNMESDYYYARFGWATSQLLDLSDASGGIWQKRSLDYQHTLPTSFVILTGRAYWEDTLAQRKQLHQVAYIQNLAISGRLFINDITSSHLYTIYTVGRTLHAIRLETNAHCLVISKP